MLRKDGEKKTELIVANRAAYKSDLRRGRVTDTQVSLV
jgi:hypothetical protein